MVNAVLYKNGNDFIFFSLFPFIWRCDFVSVILISEYEIMICIMKGFYEIIRVTKKLYE